jgi:hypothetical protein
MAKEEREFKDVYWVRLLERQQGGIRQQQELHRFESSAGALKKFEELVLEHEGKEGQWIVDVLFIHEGQFFTVKERRLWL